MTILPQPNREHHITVTEGVFGRAWFECSCGIERVCHSKAFAVDLAKRHWSEHHEPLLHPTDPGPGSPEPVTDASTA